MGNEGCFVSGDEWADVAVVVVTYNSARDIRNLLSDLRRDARHLALRVIVVDNESADDSADIVAAETDVILVRAGGNLGYAGGINRARRHIGRCTGVLVLNPDLRLRRHAIDRLLDSLSTPGIGAVVPLNIFQHSKQIDPTLRREPSISRALGDAIVGGRRFPRRPSWLSETELLPECYTFAHSVDWATGSAMMIRADVERAVGNWNENYFLYSEEIDYCRRIREQGRLVWFEPAAVVEHAGGGSGTSAALSMLATVNRVRYIEDCHSRPYALAFRAVIAFTQAIRAHRPVPRASLQVVLNRERWRDLPHATQS
ncbi:glycosyltransferase [Rhodococcus sp. NPDC003383]